MPPEYWQCKPYMIWYVDEYTGSGELGESGRSYTIPFTAQQQHDYFRKIKVNRIRDNFHALKCAVMAGAWTTGWLGSYKLLNYLDTGDREALA